MAATKLPRLYPILDAAAFPDATAMFAAAEELAAAGCTLLQYRNKQGTARQILDQARELRVRLGTGADSELLCPPATAELRSAWTLRLRSGQAREGARPHTSANVKLIMIMNDRADLCLAADFDGLHVGQDDLSPESARKIIGPTRWLGVSTHNPEQTCGSRSELPPTTLPSAPSLRLPARPIPIPSSDSQACAGQGN